MSELILLKDAIESGEPFVNNKYPDKIITECCYIDMAVEAGGKIRVPMHSIFRDITWKIVCPEKKIELTESAIKKALNKPYPGYAEMSPAWFHKVMTELGFDD